MPKITRHGGPTNARDAEPSPDADASQPLLAGAEADQEGRPTLIDGDVVTGEPLAVVPAGAYAEDAEPLAEPEADPYAGKTLTELREMAEERGVASYGSKAQITERLRETAPSD